jgi:ketosteroid isomerase-like protein
MSNENVEVIESIFARWERGDFSSPDWMHHQMEFVGGDGIATRGASAVGKFWFDFLGTWDRFVVLADEILDAGDDDVLVFVRFEGHGRESGAPIAAFSGANLFTLQDGKVIRLVLYVDRKEALSAAGLSD